MEFLLETVEFIFDKHYKETLIFVTILSFVMCLGIFVEKACK